MDYTVCISQGTKPITSKTWLTEPPHNRDKGQRLAKARHQIYRNCHYSSALLICSLLFVPSCWLLQFTVCISQGPKPSTTKIELTEPQQKGNKEHRLPKPGLSDLQTVSLICLLVCCTLISWTTMCAYHMGSSPSHQKLSSQSHKKKGTRAPRPQKLHELF